MELTLQILQFVLAISILVLLHELGHFLPAKYFKTKVEKFYLFFDPWFSLIKKKVGDTEYGIGWLPLGGYVKIAGMVDESMDTDQMKTPPQPWEFRSKPAWQRLIIMLGGVTVNFFLAWAIFSGLSMWKGESYTDMSKFQYGLGATPAAEKMGFKSGDKIIAVDGKPTNRLEAASLDVLFANQVTVLRNGQEVTFPVNENGVADVIKSREAKLYLLPRMTVKVDTVVNPANAKAGLQKGDVITGINGKPTRYYDEFTKELLSHKNSMVTLEVVRGNVPVQISQIQVGPEGKLGFGLDYSSLKDLNTTKSYSFFEAIPRGLERTIESLTTHVKQFKIIFNSKTQGYKSVGGPIAIVKMMPVDQKAKGEYSINWAAFWSFTAMFSVWLAFLNLLPIPGLDGGHVMFTLWEMITGKPVPQKVLENAQMIGMIFLLGLMLLIFGNDILKIFTGKL